MPRFRIPTAPVIPSRLPRTVMLDTCVLSEVITQPDLREWFAHWLNSGDVTCYLSVLTLGELIGDVDGQGGTRDARIIERLKGLRALRNQVGTRLRAAADFVDTVFAEVHQYQSHPVEDDEETSALNLMTRFEDRELPKLLSWASSPADYIKRKKNTLYELDRSIHAKSKRLVQESPENNQQLARGFSVDSVVRTINGRDIPHPLSELVAERLLKGQMTAKQIEERLPHCPVLNCAEQLVWRSYLANGAPPGAKQEEIALFRTKTKTGRGDWYDHYVAATAAACTMFITGDKRLLRRCEHIQRLGVSVINAYKAETVIEGYSPSASQIESAAPADAPTEP